MSKQIKFEGDRRWWTVRAEDERFTILTRQRNFHPRGEVFYTIIDRERGVRGPCDLIGQGWDFRPDALEESAAELLRALNAHVEVGEWFKDKPAGTTRPVTEVQTQVSFRNNVPIKIEAER